MPIIIAILLACAAAVWWWIRSNPRDAMGMADDALTVARNAPRKIAFRRQTKEHPVQGIDDPVLASVALGFAMLELDDLPAREERARLHLLTRRIWRLSEEEAEETLSLARWLVAQCGSADAALSRIGRRLQRIDDGSAWPDLQALIAGLGEDGLSPAQADAFQDLHRRLTGPERS
ncbi:hypothetical protein MWU52_16845 [Jannaschia sp. S6380]|uniref:hypothetical protein n=1 Tax=Jannaschia sp. S6380 TaxID=2926408 RepID=UPI001FF60025|nr:hypothetical protein [Jannaschia sp. S6380]MCK0169224.1 hypothetical protein [Jannaschia sp. S6380]